MMRNEGKSFWNKPLLMSVVAMLTLSSCNRKQPADFVILNARVITVNENFDIEESLAVRGDRIIYVGPGSEVTDLIGDQTRVIDAGGMSVLPGLIEAHLHPEAASLSELRHPIPDVHTINGLLQWIHVQAAAKKKGDWIFFPKFFYTRLRERRPPTLEELDRAAPDNPVFLDGSYGGVINTAAMEISGISGTTDHPGIVKDPSGKPTGIIKRTAYGMLKFPPSGDFTNAERVNALTAMLRRYNRYGITSVCEGAGNFPLYKMYQDLARKGELTTRVLVNIRLPVDKTQSPAELTGEIKHLPHKTGDGNEWVRVGALKIILDGGILTGTAFLREPWGERAAEIFDVDTAYRGVINYAYEDLFPLVKTAAELGWKFTAHCTGGGGVDRLLDVYEAVDKEIPLKDKRFSIIHGNFFTPEAIERMHKLGIYADMQAAWFYKDAVAMNYILGSDRIKTFMPYRSLLDAGVMVNGGSDHMVKFDADSSINPYNPFLAMWSMVTRKTEDGTVITPEEAISREEAVRIYTIHNAYASFEEDLKGSVEQGKLADIAILDHDIMHCPVDEIKNTKSILTMVGGKVVYSSAALRDGLQYRPDDPSFCPDGSTVGGRR